MCSRTVQGALARGGTLDIGLTKGLLFVELYRRSESSTQSYICMSQLNIGPSICTLRRAYLIPPKEVPPESPDFVGSTTMATAYNTPFIVGAVL